MSSHLPPVALLLSAKLADFDKWYDVFNAHEGLRREHGIVGHHVNRDRDDPNLLYLYFAVADVEGARRFLASDEIKQVMKEAGVLTPPQVTWLKPQSESIIWDRELPAMIVQHSVADYERFREHYDRAEAFRKTSGILGHATNQLLDDPRTIVVYHQAESFESLESFIANPDLKGIMDAAGVTSAPKVTFATGGWSKRYV